MMNEQHWTDRLSEYLDGEMDATGAAALEMHLGTCDECRTTLEELRTVVTAAADLPDRLPSRNLFPGILERIGEGDDAVVVPLHPLARPARRFTFSVPQLAAAAAVVMSVTAGAVWFAKPDPQRAPVVAGEQAVSPAVSDPASSPDDPAATAAQFVSDTQASYQVAIDRLERELAERRDELDPATIDVVERNLAIIDTAIAEARTALESDPSNAYLYRHFDNTLNMKVELLRRATRRAAT
jgi:hypothetical protein